jgi:ATP-dependent Clp protease ATP-binding subunit ClpC
VHTSLGFAKGGDQEVTYGKMKDTLMSELKRVFNPEFLNRVDETIVFHQLTKDHLRRIVDLMLERLQRQLGEKKILLQIDEAAKDFLINQGYDPKFGARPLRRAIQRHVEDALAEEVLKGRFPGGGEIRITSTEQGLAFQGADLLQAPG